MELLTWLWVAAGYIGAAWVFLGCPAFLIILLLFYVSGRRRNHDPE